MDISRIPFGEVHAFNVLIEIPEGSKNKYEYNEQLKSITLDFVFSGDVVWPFNYGSICGTRGGDGDMLDAIVLSTEPLAVGTIAACRTVGMAEMLDRGEVDNKLLCVPIADKQMEMYQDIDSFSEEQLRSYEDFYQELAVQKNKIIEFKGYHGKKRAEEELEGTRGR